MSQGPFEGRNITNSSMVGTGLTMEGIFQNYVMYDLMLEMGWRTSPPDPVQWWVTGAALRVAVHSQPSRLFI